VFPIRTRTLYAMARLVIVKLDDNDLGQILEGLEARAEAWEKTADYHRTGESPSDFIVEESSDEHEANGIARHYRSIIAKIRKQQEEQT
jgi:ATP-dependent exoDNAse (exonuclease V) beta subunit